MDEFNQYDYQAPSDPETEKKAKNAKTMGIVGIVCSLCCTYVGLILGIIALVQANGVAQIEGLSQQAKNDANNAKICGIVAIVISALTIGVNIIMMASGNNPLQNLLG